MSKKKGFKIEAMECGDLEIFNKDDHVHLKMWLKGTKNDFEQIILRKEEVGLVIAILEEM